MFWMIKPPRRSWPVHTGFQQFNTRGKVKPYYVHGTHARLKRHSNTVVKLEGRERESSQQREGEALYAGVPFVKAEKEWKASPRLVPTYFPRPSGDEREAQWMEWHGLEPPSSGYDRPPEVANADVGGVGEWELAGA